VKDPDLRVRWRVDEHDGRVVRACHGEAPSPADPVMAVAATAEVGQHVADLQNGSVRGAAWREGHDAGVYDTEHPGQIPHPNPYTAGWFSPDYLG
jgi:hypothetical protein